MIKYKKQEKKRGGDIMVSGETLDQPLARSEPAQEIVEQKGLLLEISPDLALGMRAKQGGVRKSRFIGVEGVFNERGEDGEMHAVSETNFILISETMSEEDIPSLAEALKTLVVKVGVTPREMADFLRGVGSAKTRERVEKELGAQTT